MIRIFKMVIPTSENGNLTRSDEKADEPMLENVEEKKIDLVSIRRRLNAFTCDCSLE